jgi:hypothetical protein
MRRFPVFFFAALLCAGAATAGAQQSAPSQTLPQQFQHLEDTWSVALVNKDQYALDNLLAPTFVDISAKAQVTTRNQYISDTLTGEPEPLLSVEQKVVSVRVLSDVAIVEGTYMLKVRGSGDRLRDERGIYTHIYARSRNTWSCVNAQNTEVVDMPDKATRAPEKKTGKSSGSFHIPLIH